MINQTLYEKTVNILVDAYMNDTLEHGACCACAVGNLVCANMGLTNGQLFIVFMESKIKHNLGWHKVFVTHYGTQSIHEECLSGQAKEQIDSTGYHWKDLAKIEYAFETAYEGKGRDEYMFNGLMAVINVLDEIHENTDAAITSQSKSRFSKV